MKEDIVPVAFVYHEDGTTDVIDSYQDPAHDDGVDFETKLLFFLQYYQKDWTKKLPSNQSITLCFHNVMKELLEKYGTKKESI
jgi:hypothetical protein